LRSSKNKFSKRFWPNETDKKKAKLDNLSLLRH